MPEIPLTVALVVKNEVKFISQAISSLLTTCPKFIKLQILIVDDWSNDGTYEYCKEIESKNSAVVVVRNPSTGKVAGTLTAFSQVKSGWMKFVDGDDYVDFNGLQPADFDCSAFYHNFGSFSESAGLQECRTSPIFAIAPRSFVLKLRTIPKAMFFFKREIFDNINYEALKELMFEDIIINFYIGIRAKRIKKITKSLYFYRQHEANFYGGSFRGDRDKIAIMADRLLSSQKVLSNLHPELKFHSGIAPYASVLKSLKSYKNIFFLLRFPEFFLKALYYHVISRV